MLALAFYILFFCITGCLSRGPCGIHGAMADWIRQFYLSAAWLHKRDDILERDNNECQRCKKRGKYHKAECVHHIKHLKDRPDLKLINSNLISLCYNCHNEEHPEKGYRESNVKRFVNEERW